MAKYRITPSSKAIIQLPISIGHKAEKGVEAIEFDLTAWVETYGSGTLTVIMRRWGDAIPYPIALEIDENNKATWTLSDIDTAKAGMAYAQLNYIVGETVVKKSDIYTFRVMDSLTGEGEPPEAYESWLEHLTHFAAEAMAEVLDIEGIVTDKTLTVDGGIADAKATGDALSALEDAVTEETDKLKADLDDLDDRVTALEGSGGGGSGLTDDVKTALMNLADHLAWDDDDPTGQTYITALYNALYPPAPPASLTNITAVYTQSGTVFETDTLNDLKSDLVVTAHYSDNTSHAVTDYTLSGTLAVGTSTIAVAYGGKTTTFTVTVTAGALYPLENGSHTFTANNRVLTVTNGNHFVYEWSGATTAAVNGAYLNLSTVSDNDTSAEDASNVVVNDPIFTIPANAQVVFEIKNISFSNVGTAGSSNKYAFNIRNGGTSLGMATGDKGISDTADISVTKTFDADTPATCIFLYVSRQFSRFEADISLTVNNVRWI